LILAILTVFQTFWRSSYSHWKCSEVDLFSSAETCFICSKFL